MNRNEIRIAALFALIGVGLGAFGAHALAERLESVGRTDAWKTAVFYQLLHSVALLVLALSGRKQTLTRWCWVGGILLFSGSLYGLCLLENARWLGPVTPLGGLLLMIGWLALIVRPPRGENPETP